jgi:hypothetical protein
MMKILIKGFSFTLLYNIMRFKQFVEIFDMGSGIPSDPTSFWKLPNISQGPTSYGGGFTGLFYRLNQKKQLEMRALEKLSMKAEQLAAAINTSSKDMQDIFPHTFKLGGGLTPEIKGEVICNIALDDIRKTTGGGGYHQALMPYEYTYAEKNGILVPHPNNPDLGDFNVAALRKTSHAFYLSYYGGQQLAQWGDQAATAIGNKAMQGSLRLRNTAGVVSAA